MCVATAGKVIEVRDDATALVDFDGNRVSAMKEEYPLSRR